MTIISILCTDPTHPINPILNDWVTDQAGIVNANVYRDYRELVGGDFLFLVSSQQIIKRQIRNLFRYTLVLHASALPEGRGMSPHVWEVLAGKDKLTVTLLNAEDALDSGDIWQQRVIYLNGTELHSEINRKLFDAELELMSWALANCDAARPRQQSGEPTFYRRRTPEDSRFDPTQSVTEIFDLLRVADSERYPAFFEHRGRRYRMRIDPF